MENNIEVKKSERGVFLWIMLAIAILVSFQRFIELLFPASFANMIANGPRWGHAFDILCLIAEIVAIIGILFWKRWGVLLLAITYIVEVLVSYIYFSSRISIISILGDAIIILCLIWAVARKWPLFS
jgi:hypothetical protein